MCSQCQIHRVHTTCKLSQAKISKKAILWMALSLFVYFSNWLWLHNRWDWEWEWEWLWFAADYSSVDQVVNAILSTPWQASPSFAFIGGWASLAVITHLLCWPQLVQWNMPKYFANIIPELWWSLFGFSVAFTSTETIRLIRDGEPRTAISTLNSSWALNNVKNQMSTDPSWKWPDIRR